MFNLLDPKLLGKACRRLKLIGPYVLIVIVVFLRTILINVLKGLDGLNSIESVYLSIKRKVLQGIISSSLKLSQLAMCMTLSSLNGLLLWQ